MSIRVKTLDEAVVEAKRFIKAAEMVKRRADWNTYSMDDKWYNGGKECAAVKRASMDLTRALAGVRRGGG